MREEICYENSHCSTQTSNSRYMSKMNCCCTRGAAWGSSCERCPSHGTSRWFKTILFLK
jgi:hypothetical protein